MVDGIMSAEQGKMRGRDDEGSDDVEMELHGRWDYGKLDLRTSKQMKKYKGGKCYKNLSTVNARPDDCGRIMPSYLVTFGAFEPS